MTEPTYDVLAAGEINVDLILSGDVEPAFGQAEKWVQEATLTVGSSSAIFACAAARLGLRVLFCGLCGDDWSGKFMLDEMVRRGVDLSAVKILPGERTGVGVILNRGEDRAIFTYPGLIPLFQAADVNEVWLRQARHLHVASYFLQTGLQSGLPGLFEQAHSFGLTTSLDTNWDPAERWQGLGAALAQTDIFFPNQVEACALSGVADVEQAAHMLAQWVGLLGVKLGSAGGLGLSGDRIARAAALPMEVVDTVGAGDTFDAGFLYGVLNGWSLERTIRLAAVCGSLSTRQRGGVDGQPTLNEALEYL